MQAGQLLCWAMSDGRVGKEIQCLGLAEALGLVPDVKRVTAWLPWRWTKPWFPGGELWLSRGSSALGPPWPDLIVGCGRQSVAPALAIRERARRGARGKRVFLVQIQNPTMPLHLFDLVVAPRHDRLEGGNVIETLGSIHRVTPDRLAAERERWAPQLSRLPQPRIALLLGGNSRSHRLPDRRAAEIGRRLAKLAAETGGSVMVTPSRRTPRSALAALNAELAQLPHYVWTGEGDGNPYYGILAHADAAVVTSDSVNLATEAVARGGPVFVARIEGGSRKFEAFHTNMRELGYTRPFEGALDFWQPPPFAEVVETADAIRRRLPLPWP